MDTDLAGLDERRFVLGEPTLQDAAREHADEPAVLDHGHALEIVLLELAERVVERERHIDRVERRLGDLSETSRTWIAAGCDDLPDERLAGDHADQPAVVGHE